MYYFRHFRKKLRKADIFFLFLSVVLLELFAEGDALLPEIFQARQIFDVFQIQMVVMTPGEVGHSGKALRLQAPVIPRLQQNFVDIKVLPPFTV